MNIVEGASGDYNKNNNQHAQIEEGDNNETRKII